MGVFPRFGGWINQNIQRLLQAESDTTSKNGPPNMKIYYDEDEDIRQDKLWSAAEKIHPWYDPPPKIKVTTKKGLCHMNIEMTMGLTPDGAFELITNPNNIPFFNMGKLRPELMENKSRKVLKEDGPRQIAKLNKAVAWEFLWWSGAIPIKLIVDENRKNLTAKYKKKKMMFMKVFEGSWKVEPLYVDSERLCKHIKPKTREEYKKCSGGQGKIASKVTIDQYFQTYPLFDFPPLSWYIHGITIKTTKTLLQMLQFKSIVLREVALP